MKHRHQHDTSTPDLSIGSPPVEWLLEESRQLREEKAALLHDRQALLHRRDLLFQHQLLLIERLKIQASRLQTLSEDTTLHDVGQGRAEDGTETDDEV